VRLSQTDREAIAALIARVEKIETLIGITEHGGKWSAFTGRTGEGRGGTFLDYSAYDLQKQSGQWRVIRRGEGISPMVIRLVLTTPPDERPKGQ